MSGVTVSPGGEGPEQLPVQTLAVLQYQVGSMQTSLDKGLGALERAIDKGFDQVNVRMDKFESRLRIIEDRQTIETARVNDLERHRKELEAEQARLNEARDARLADALDDSQMAKVWRTLGAAAVGLAALAGPIVAIVSH